MKIGETPDLRLQTRRPRLEARTNVGLTTRWKVNVSGGGAVGAVDVGARLMDVSAMSWIARLERDGVRDRDHTALGRGKL